MRLSFSLIEKKHTYCNHLITQSQKFINLLESLDGKGKQMIIYDYLERTLMHRAFHLIFPCPQEFNFLLGENSLYQIDTNYFHFYHSPNNAQTLHLLGAQINKGGQISLFCFLFFTAIFQFSKFLDQTTIFVVSIILSLAAFQAIHLMILHNHGTNLIWLLEFLDDLIASIISFFFSSIQ